MRAIVVDERDLQQEIEVESFRVWAMTRDDRHTVYEIQDATLGEILAWAESQPFVEWSLSAMVRLPDGFTAVWLKGRDPSDKRGDSF